MRRKTKLYFLGSLLVCIVIIIGCIALWTNRNLTVYDEDFKVLGFNNSTGGTHTFYYGNQTVGRIRAWLTRQYGLKFIGVSPSAVVRVRGPRSHAFILRYTGDFPFEELYGLRAVLTNDKDVSQELPPTNMPLPADQTFVICYILPALPQSEDSFRIDFILKSADDPVASWRLGKLYRRKKENNSGQ